MENAYKIRFLWGEKEAIAWCLAVPRTGESVRWPDGSTVLRVEGVVHILGNDGRADADFGQQISVALKEIGKV